MLAIHGPKLSVEIKTIGVAAAMVEMNSALMAAGQGVPSDAEQRGQARAIADQQQRRIGTAGDIEAFTIGPLDIEAVARRQIVKYPVAHAAARQALDVDVEAVVETRHASQGIASHQTVATPQINELAGPVIKRRR